MNRLATGLFISGITFGALAGDAWAQSAWEPSRIPTNSSARPLNSVGSAPQVPSSGSSGSSAAFDQAPDYFQPPVRIGESNQPVANQPVGDAPVARGSVPAANRVSSPIQQSAVRNAGTLEGRRYAAKKAAGVVESNTQVTHAHNAVASVEAEVDNGAVLRWTSVKPVQSQPVVQTSASHETPAQPTEMQSLEVERRKRQEMARAAFEEPASYASRTVQYAFEDASESVHANGMSAAGDAPPPPAAYATQNQSTHKRQDGYGNKRRQLVQQANYQLAYQQDSTTDPFSDNFGGPPSLPQQGQGTLPANPQDALGEPPSLEPLSLGQSDALVSPENAPVPGIAPQSPSDTSEDYPFENAYAEQGADQGTLPPPGSAEDDLDLPDPNRGVSVSCDDRRDRIRGLPISKVSLDTSPAFGRGLSSRDEIENMRLQFAESTPVRDWRDTSGQLIATGRLLDVSDERVVLDVNGSKRFIWLQELSDVDSAYIGEAWNIPLQCGVGSEAYAGRSFVPSTVQFTAPGQCHKPLYFEQVQLERYGHEVGPILQPMLSTAHFFTNIGVLPYKMGIHPPNECQYSLGYYRPGNCAPYMMQPVPISLRGAAAQAGVAGFASAFIP